MMHVPVLRAGKAYRSLNQQQLVDIRDGEAVATMSIANSGLIARDMLDASQRREQLSRIPIAELLSICKRAAELFMTAALPLDPEEGTTQSAEAFVQIQSATTGMPQALCRANMQKIHFVLDEMEAVLAGLTRGLDLSALDDGWVEQDGRTVSYICDADSLGAVLPSNSPGVHSLWIPSLALKVPVVLKPGSREPWTPLRIGQALIQAGLPGIAFGYYPADYAGSREILMRCDRSMLFGDESTVAPWRNDHRVQLHGPGWSKVLLGGDQADHWKDHLELMATSIAQNGGRSCVNASGVWVPKHGAAVAEALAQRLVRVEARPLDDPEAEIAAFSDPAVAHRISEFIDRQLETPGAEDVTARLRGGPRVAEVDGCTFLLPTLIRCDDPDHPLASTELLFPFASVVERPQSEMLQHIGPSLVVTALTDDETFGRQLMSARSIDRLNLGRIPTGRVSWDQPHEGNLFEHLYRQRSFQGTRHEPAA
jgi:acyl-CoA reductase-like NAD-dependent aldehyde dehydrogenase